MGHQQLLFTLLAVCVVGIMISIGVITLQEALRPDNRTGLTQELLVLARSAQEYYKKPSAGGGGEGTFMGLTTSMQGILRITSKPSSTNGDFFIKRAGNVHTVEILGVGVTPGRDPRYPVRLSVIVWPDSAAIVSLN